MDQGKDFSFLYYLALCMGITSIHVSVWLIVKSVTAESRKACTMIGGEVYVGQNVYCGLWTSYTMRSRKFVELGEVGLWGA